MNSPSSRQVDNASKMRCNITTVQAVRPHAAVWQRLDKGVLVNESANEIIEIPARGYARDLKKSVSKGAVVMVDSMNPTSINIETAQRKRTAGGERSVDPWHRQPKDAWKTHH